MGSEMCIRDSYGISHIMEDLGCAHNKAEKLLSELEQAGLLRRKRQGLGKPSAPPEIRKPNFLTFDFRISRTLKISVQVR